MEQVGLIILISLQLEININQRNQLILVLLLQVHLVLAYPGQKVIIQIIPEFREKQVVIQKIFQMVLMLVIAQEPLQLPVD